jgi:hypothetical protein
MAQTNSDKPTLSLKDKGPAPADAPTPADDAATAPALPESVTLVSHYGYIAEDGNRRHWIEGAVEKDPALIAELIERKAPLKV